MNYNNVESFEISGFDLTISSNGNSIFIKDGLVDFMLGRIKLFDKSNNEISQDAFLNHLILNGDDVSIAYMAELIGTEKIEIKSLEELKIKISDLMEKLESSELLDQEKKEQLESMKQSLEISEVKLKKLIEENRALQQNKVGTVSKNSDKSQAETKKSSNDNDSSSSSQTSNKPEEPKPEEPKPEEPKPEEPKPEEPEVNAILYVTAGLSKQTDSGTLGDKVTNNNNPTLVGEATPNASLIIYINGKQYLVTVPSNGEWSFDLPDSLPDGNHVVYIKISDGVTEKSINTSIHVDTAIENISIEPFKNDDGFTHLTKPFLSGKAEPGTAITITIGNSSFTTTASSDGVWGIQISTDLPQGENTIFITSSDSAGNTTEYSDTFIVDSTPPSGYGGLDVKSDSGLVGDNITSFSRPVLSGTASSDTKYVKVYFGALLEPIIIQLPLNSSGDWEYEIPSNIPDGIYHLSFEFIDYAGNSSGVSESQAITIDTHANINELTVLLGDSSGEHGTFVTNDIRPILNGFAPEDAKSISISINGYNYSVPVVNGLWSFQLPELPEGNTSISLSFSDLAGNASDAMDIILHIDRTPPDGNVQLTNDSGNGLSNSSTPVFNGTSHGGAEQVVIYLDGIEYAYVNVKSDGSWEFTVPTALSDGEYFFEFSFKDAAGNKSSTQSVSVVVDTVVDFSIDVTDFGGKKYLSGIVEKGAKIEIEISGIKYNETNGVVVNGDGSWSLDISNISNSISHTYVANVTDAAGNKLVAHGSISGNAELFINGGLNPSSDTGVIGDNITNKTSPIYSGWATPGSSVKVEIKNSSGKVMQTLTCAVGLSGYWEVQANTLSDGNYYVSISSYLDGDSITLPDTSLKIDNALHVEHSMYGIYNVTNPSGSGWGTNDDFFILKNNKKFEPYSVIEVSVGGYNQKVTVDKNGDFYASVGPLSNGKHSVTITVTDVAGNSISHSSHAAIVDKANYEIIDLKTTATMIEGTIKGFNQNTKAYIMFGDSKILLSVNSNGKFSFDTNGFEIGIQAFTIQVESAWGKVVTESSFINIYSEVLLDGSPNLLSNDGEFVLSGTNVNATNGSVKIVINGSEFNLILNSAGEWSLPVNSGFDVDGKYPIKIIYYNAGGVIIESQTVNVTVDTFIDLAPSGDSYSTEYSAFYPAHNKYIDFYASGANSVEVTLNGVTKKYNISKDGVISFKISDFVSWNEIGTHDITVTVTDNAGNKKTLTEKVYILGWGDSVYNASIEGANFFDGSFHYNGSSAPILSVSSKNSIDAPGIRLVNKLYINGKCVYTFGNEPVDISSFLSKDGIYTIRVESELDTPFVNGKFQGSSTITINYDVTPPEVGDFHLSDGSDSGDIDGVTHNNKPTIIGKTEANAIVKLVIGGYVYETKADSNGNWQISVKNSLPDGELKYIVQVSDIAGNSAQSEGGVYIDTVLPTFSTSFANDIGGGLVASDDLTIIISPNSSFRSVVISLNGIQYTATLNESGLWVANISSLRDGIYSITVTVTDDKGYTNSSESLVTIDTTAPEQSDNIELTQDTDTGAAGDFITSNKQPTLTGTVAADAEWVVVYATGLDGTSISLRAEVVNGVWQGSFSEMLSDGEYQLSVEVFDAAGNSSGKTELDSLTIDTTAPIIGSVGLALESDNITSNQKPTIEGDILYGHAIKALLYINEFDSQPQEVDVSNGRWSHEVEQNLNFGLNEIIIVYENAEGTRSAAHEMSLIVGEPHNKQNKNDVTISGFAPVSANSVAVSYQDDMIAQAAVNNGSWSIVLEREPQSPLLVSFYDGNTMIDNEIIIIDGNSGKMDNVINNLIEDQSVDELFFDFVNDGYLLDTHQHLNQ
ncbi:MAG: Ig-like domain-containing protein [Turicibacter sp.]